ncbi:uncharacterized protein G2W53_000322 [Senna tora]|uniref:Uncharacterized protein n=1 Tax=Senna tora TaxID=362788 RepID=A0A834XE68_9FABA|nr:uncharacterized protein G2W53_000322 [Senna tora]
MRGKLRGKEKEAQCLVSTMRGKMREDVPSVQGSFDP